MHKVPVYIYQIADTLSGQRETFVSKTLLTRSGIADRVSDVFRPAVLDEIYGFVIPQDGAGILSSSGQYNKTLTMIEGTFYEE